MKQARLFTNKGIIIVTDRKRRFWLVSLVALALVVIALMRASLIDDGRSLWEIFRLMIDKTGLFLVIILGIVGLSYERRLYIDIEKQRYRPTIEMGPIKMGKWISILNPEYVSVFYKDQISGGTLHQVNLWYDENKWVNLFEMHNQEEAFSMGHEISELLNIDLLDATDIDNFRWVEKDNLRNQSDESTTETTKQIRAKGGE